MLQLLTGIEIPFCSNCISYTRAFASLLLLDMLCLRVRMFTGVSLVLRNCWRGLSWSRTQIRIWKTPTTDKQSVFHLWDRSDTCLCLKCSVTDMQTFHRKRVGCSFRDGVWPIHLVSTKGFLCCKDLIPSLNRASEESSLSIPECARQQ